MSAGVWMSRVALTAGSSVRWYFFLVEGHPLGQTNRKGKVSSLRLRGEHVLFLG